MTKGAISNILRSLRILYVADTVRFWIYRLKNSASNNEFLQQNPEVRLPPDYLMYEAFRLNYRLYYNGGKQTAQWLAGIIERYCPLENKRILDWGCGPGRVIRHMPAIAGQSSELYGTDYNQESIRWCSQNLPGIQFSVNTLSPALAFKANYFDVIYGLSIITHLSEAMHYGWYTELYRVLRPGGILILSSQGDNFTGKLTKNELETYVQGKLVVRGKVKEGHRTYSAFHPAGFMRRLFKNATILEHITREPEGDYLPQDLWIVQKPVS